MSTLKCRAVPSRGKRIDDIGVDAFQISDEITRGGPTEDRFERTAPDPPSTRRSSEFNGRTSRNSHRDLLPRLDATQDLRDLVAQFLLRDCRY